VVTGSCAEGLTSYERAEGNERPERLGISRPTAAGTHTPTERSEDGAPAAPRRPRAGGAGALIY